MNKATRIQNDQCAQRTARPISIPSPTTIFLYFLHFFVIFLCTLIGDTGMSSLTFASLIRPILLFFAAFIVLLPLRWQWRTSKVPAFSLIAWLFVSNFINAIGSVIWMKDTGPGLNGRLNGAVSLYCDIGEFSSIQKVGRTPRLMSIPSNQNHCWFLDSRPSSSGMYRKSTQSRVCQKTNPEHGE